MRGESRARSGEAFIVRSRVISILAAVVVSAAACAPRSIDSSKSVEIEFWTLALAPFKDYLRARISAFEGANPGVRVRWVDVPFEAIDRKLIAAAASGRAPDVVNLSDRTFGRFVGLGAMTDLTPFLPGDPQEAFLPGALSLGRIDGRLLCLPWYLTTQVGLYNRELLGQGGLDERTLAGDWQGLLRQAGEFRRATGAYLFSQALGEESQLPTMLLAEGLVPLREGPGGRVVADLDRPEIREFVGAWVRAYREGALPAEAATRDHSHLTEMYQNRRLALVDTGPNFLVRVRDVAPSVYAQTGVRPPVTGRLGRSHIATMVVCVTSRSEHPREAAALAWFMTSAESQDELCRHAPVLSSSRGVVAERARGLRAEQTSEDVVARARGLAFGSLSTAVAFTPALVTWPDLRRAFEEGIKRALLDGEDVGVCLRRIHNEWDRILSAGPPEGMGAVPRPAAVEVGG